MYLGLTGLLLFVHIIKSISDACRWPQHFLRSDQHLCPHCHVYLLHAGCYGTSLQKIHLVEEIPDKLPDDSVHHDLHPRFPGRPSAWQEGGY